MMLEEDVIVCPECGKEQTIKICPVANVTENPELREQVLSGELFRFTCVECGHTGFAGYPFVYQDDVTAGGFFLYLEPGCTDRAVGIEGEKEDDTYLSKIFRLVPDLNVLKEKVFLFECGLDDRVMELFKVLTQTKLHGDDPERVPDTLLFTKLDEVDGEKMIFLAAFREGKYLGILELPFSLYESCVETGDPIWNVPLRDCPAVDGDWIVERLKVEESLEE